MFSTNGDIKIQITNYAPQITQPAHLSESPILTTLIFASYSFQIDRLFNRTFPKLGLCDIVLINIDLQNEHHRFFAVVVHVVDHWPHDMEKVENIKMTDDKEKEYIIEVKSDVVLYISKECSDAVEKHCKYFTPQIISVVKLTNITSSRRHISAIYNLSSFSKRRNLLKPSNIDPYFQQELLNNPAAVPGNFNTAQISVIRCAEEIFNDNENDHLHLVHGPPGMLLSLLTTFGKVSELYFI